ncbi:MAG: MFS transporter [Ignavibacteriaceae bacterium]
MEEKLLKYLGINRAVLALSVARMADAVGNSVLFIIIPLYVAKLPKEYFHFPIPVLVGALIAIYGFVAALLQPVMGALSDKLGKRKILIQAGLGLLGVSTLTYILAQHFFDLLILRTFQGVAVAITIPASMALMAEITKKESRGGAMGVYSTLRIVGFAIGPLVGGFLKDRYGFNAAFFAGFGFIILAMFLIQIWVKDVKVKKGKEELTKKIRIFEKKLLSPGILSAASATFMMAASFSILTALENEFNSKLSINAFQFGVAFSMLMVTRLIFQVPLGKYSDSIGRKPLILAGLILMCPATILLGIAGTLTQLIIYRLIQGIAAAGIAAPAFAVAADLSQSGGEGRQMSIITMGFGLGIATGPLVAGLLAVIFFELPFIALGFLSLVSIWIVYHYMPETVVSEKALFKHKS